MFCSEQLEYLEDKLREYRFLEPTELENKVGAAAMIGSHSSVGWHRQRHFFSADTRDAACRQPWHASREPLQSTARPSCCPAPPSLSV